MIERRIPDFDLDQIARSGQCFRMERTGEDSFSLIAHGRYLTLAQQGDIITFGCEEDEFQQLWRHYFDLDTDYGAIKRAVSKRDKYLQAAVEIGGGIRILRQDLWETIVCFIISQQNNITRIKKCVEKLSLLLGETCYNKSKEVYYSFPTPEALARCEVEDLADCRLGYRAKYLIRSAQQVATGEVDLEAIRLMPYERAKEELLRFTGVGVKVAECICLFALHHVDAFPIDTHIRQMLDEHYPKGFPMKRYKGFAGILQQYGFFYELRAN